MRDNRILLHKGILGCQQDFLLSENEIIVQNILKYFFKVFEWLKDFFFNCQRKYVPQKFALLYVSFRDN